MFLVNRREQTLPQWRQSWKFPHKRVQERAGGRSFRNIGRPFPESAYFRHGRECLDCDYHTTGSNQREYYLPLLRFTMKI